MEHQTLTSELVDDREDPETSTVGEAVAEEVHRPALIRACCWRQLEPSLAGSLPAPSRADLKAFLLVEAIDQLVPDLEAFPSQKDPKPPIAIAWP